jgi:arylsulfatase A-like enzyme
MRPEKVATKGLLLFCLLGSSLPASGRQSNARSVQPPIHPNVVLIITDDQGYGDLGFHGNSKIHTPNLDRLARESVQFQSFYVSPVCSPTRASLLTGRYNYRTGVVDTYLGRSLMHPDESTLAEMLAAGGYSTGIFGKWHLGDNYPLRAMDQGFQESLTLNGGGIGQPSDPVGGESYFDPMLRRNGRWVKTKGYISDVITDAAIEFIAENQNRPFFTYLAFNAPHTPLEVPAEKYAKYKAMNLKAEEFTGKGHPIAKDFDSDTTAKIYRMVENIDDNVGRLLAKLDELKLTEKTLVIFLTDNGPQQPRYNAGMLRLKGTVHEGGIHVPLFVRWPGTFEAGRKVDRIAAHIDMTPTLLDVCGVSKPAAVKFDGLSLVPLLRGELVNWPDRTLFFQWHRGDVPEPGRAFAVRSQRYKLVQPQGNGEQKAPPQAPLLLFDLANDPLEERNIAAEKPEIVVRMRREYEVWFKDVTAGRDYTDPGVARITVGAPQENPVRLTRQDWRGPKAGWTPQSVGHWQVEVKRAGDYAITLRFSRLEQPGLVSVSLGGVKLQRAVSAGAATASFDKVRLELGAGTLESYVTQGDREVGMLDVLIEHRGQSTP